MRLVLLALIAMGCTPAAADSIEQTTAGWGIKTAARPVAVASNKPVMYSQYLGSCSEDSGIDCPWDGQNKEINSDWSYVKCNSLYDPVTNVNHYYRNFYQISPTAWPSTWPTTTTCHVDGTGAWLGDWAESTTTIVNHPDPDGTGSTKTALATLTTSVPLVRDAGSCLRENSEWALRTLPSGTYVDGTYQCKKANGTPYPGLTVTINENGATDVAKFHADVTTVTNASYCPIVKGGVTYNTPVPVTVEAFTGC